MKRPIAMLLALLLTAGLFVFSGCGEAPYKDSAFWTDEFGISSQKIQKQLKKQGYALTKLEGIPDSRLNHGSFSIDGIVTEESVFQNQVDFVAKCRLTKPREVYRIDTGGAFGEQKPEYHLLYTMEIKELFYSEKDFQIGDTISVWYSLIETGLNSPGKVYLTTINGSVYPKEGYDFYLFAQVFEGKDQNLHALTTISDLYQGCYNLTIIESGENEYELHHALTSLTAGGVAKQGAIDPDNDVYVYTNDMDERIQALVDQYKAKH